MLRSRPGHLAAAFVLVEPPTNSGCHGAYVQVTRLVSLTDVVILVIVAIALLVPARPITTAEGMSFHDDDARVALAFAEARARLHPQDGAKISELARRLGEAGQLDWAVQVAAAGSADSAGSPTQWRADIATSVAHADRLEVADALEWANRALSSCAAAGEESCPSWEQVRVELYQRHLDAGIKSGIDPRKDPAAFREAGEAALRRVRATDASPPPPR